MLWIGPSLGPVERACMRSVLRQSHELTLYCYKEPEGVPEGVTLSDAGEVVPEDGVVRHRNGSVALFANRFRYELQRLGRGLWIDCDTYLIAPIEDDSDYLFGEEESGLINNGVLRLPPDCPMLAPLLELFEEKKVPYWLPLLPRIAARWRLARTGRTGLASMPWGAAGPRAITALANRHGLARMARPPEVFYPVHWRDAAWIADPGIALEDMITPRTVSVHLWNERIRGFKDAPAPAGSFLARLHEEGRR
jgi:hypothetical protein